MPVGANSALNDIPRNIHDVIRTHRRHSFFENGRQVYNWSDTLQPASNMVMTVTNGRNSPARLWISHQSKETYFPLTCQVMNF